MAYACPVCAEPQVDAVHLANHVAFTAITGDDDHEAWLDSNVEGWGALGEAELAEIVVEYAEETEFPVDVDEADVGAAGHDHAHGAGHGRSQGAGHGRGHTSDHGRGGGQDAGVPSTSMPSGDLDEDAEEVLAEARELTRQMADDGGASETPEAGDGEDDDGSEASTTGSADRSSDSETQ